MTSEFKVGDKVVPVSKSFGDSFDKCKHAKKLKANEVNFLYVVGFRGEFILLNSDKTSFNAGSFYKEEDLKKFISKNQRIAALEETVAKQGEEISELKLIVAQIRKPSTVVEEALTTVTSSAEDIIEFEGKQYKKVDREAREGDVVIVKKSDSNNFAYIESAYIETQKPYMVLRNGMITDEDFSGYKGTFSVYTPDYGRTPETVDVYELMDGYNPRILMVDETPIKSPNEKRAEMIEKAKMFIEGNKNSGGYYNVYDNNNGISFPQIPFCCKVEFIVNKEKRTVIALMRGFQSNRVLAKGIAKCMPDDVFNKYIGMAIALGRALGLDVNEFEQAVQPTDFIKGQLVKYANSELLEVDHVRRNEVSEKAVYFASGTWMPAYELTIINDSNAIYGGGE